MTRRSVAADRLCRGAVLLARRHARRLAGWVHAADHHRGRALRLALLVGIGLMVWRIVRAAPGLLWFLVPAWCVAAWRAAPAAEPLEEAPADVSEGTPEEAFRALLLDAIGDRQGVHLRDVLALLHRDGHHPSWEVADVRAVCERMGIPVRQRVRVRGMGVTVGVHRDDLKAPSGAPSPADAQSPAEPRLHVA